MASRKKFNHARLGANLRSVGLLPKGYRLDKLTKNQRDRIVKLAHQHPGPAYHSNDYAQKQVSWKAARTLKRAGYEVKLSGKRPTVAFAKHGAEKVEYKKGVITREREGYRTVTRPLAGGDVYEQARKFFRTRKPGQYLTLAIDENSPFNITIDSYDDLVKYLSHWRSRYGQDKWEKLHDHFYVIETKGARGPIGKVA